MLGALHTVAAAGCECLAHAANRHAGLPESLAPVIVRLWDAVKAARSGFASGDRCLTGVGLIYEPGSCLLSCMPLRSWGLVPRPLDPDPDGDARVDGKRIYRNYPTAEKVSEAVAKRVSNFKTLCLGEFDVSRKGEIEFDVYAVFFPYGCGPEKA